MRTRQKQRVATDTWRSLGCRKTLLEYWSKRKPTVDPRWTKQQTKKLRPKTTKVDSFIVLCRGHYWVWRPTHRHATEEGSKANQIYLRGHFQSLHVVSMKFFPSHGFPPFLGSGMLHSRNIFLVPPSHISVHSDQAPQKLHFPSAVRNTKFLDWLKIPSFQALAKSIQSHL